MSAAGRGGASPAAACAFMVPALALGLAALAEVATGALGLACSLPAVVACAAAPAAACGIAWARLGRGAGWVALAALGAALAGLAAGRADPSVQWLLQQAAGVVGLWPADGGAGPLEGLLSAEPAVPADWTGACCLAALLAGAASGALAFGAGAGAALGLAFVPLLAACPRLGYEPPLWAAGAFALFISVALAAGPPMRRFGGARASQLGAALLAGALAWCVAAGACALGGAAAGEWAARAAEWALEAPQAARQAGEEAVARAREALDGAGLGDWLARRQGEGAQAGPGGEAVGAQEADGPGASGEEGGSEALAGFGGTVGRAALAPAAGEALEVEADARPEGVVYLALFHGGAYSSGTWQAVGAEGEPSGMLDEEGFRAAERLLGDGAAELSLALGDVPGGLDAGLLEPYLAVRSEAAGGGASPEASFLVLDAGAYAAGAGGALPEGLLSFADEGSPAGGAYFAWAAEEYTRVPAGELARLEELVEANPAGSADEAVRTVLGLLAERVAYTTDIEPIPEGAEVAEYPLFESHEGYCQHFATAAALMLRLYGVPARYATGLAVAPSAFERQDDGAWRAEVGFASAHAWVEVLLPGVGWVPVEATPPGSAAAPWAAAAAGGASAQGEAPAAAADDGPDAAGGQPEGSSAGLPGQDAAAPQDGGAGAGEDGAPAGEEELEAPEGAGASSGEAPGEASGEAAGERAPAARRAVAGGAARALAAALAAAARLALRARRTRALAARASAPADELLADMLELLHEAGLLEGLDGTEAGFAAELARAVPGIGEREADRLVAEALEAAFGPVGSRGRGAAPAADPRGARDYEFAVEAALPRLSWPARLRARYVRCLA